MALLTGILVATTGFTVLTGATQTSRLAVTDTVHGSSRTAYDILVRPKNTREALESERGLVRPNQMSGQYGGITVEQWKRIRGISGVDVAAPIAMVGYASAAAVVKIDLTDAIDPSLGQQVIRLRPTWGGDAGLTVGAEETPRFAYVTHRRVAVPRVDPAGLVTPDGKVLSAESLLSVGCDWRMIPYTYLELMDSGTWAPICGTWFLDNPNHSTYSVLNQAQFFVFQALPNGGFLDFTRVGGAPDELNGTAIEPKAVQRPVFEIPWPLWLSMAAVDPEQEARLVGLDKAVVSGQYLSENATGADSDPVPVLVTSRAPVAERLTVMTERVSSVPVPGVGPQVLLGRLATAPGTSGAASVNEATDLYAKVLADPTTSIRLDVTMQASAPTYVVGPDGVMHPQPVTVDPRSWQTTVSQYGELATGAQARQPWLANDGGFRQLSPSAVRPPADVRHPPAVVGLGMFDPKKISAFSSLSAVPLETYQVQSTTGADTASRAALGGRTLLPTNNPAGYLSAPPSMLMSLESAHKLMNRADLISTVRVRVTGATGVDPVSRERVRLVAEQIAGQTGLDVDVTVGSSPQPQTVALPAGKYGRPALSLNEGWSKKGVAAMIVRAVDQKSLVLFGLILIVCVLFVANAASAAVRDRRRELAVLACLGWPAWRRAALILSEVGLIGLTAGAVGTVVSIPLARSLGVEASWAHAWLAIPVAVGLTLLAGLVPAVRAGNSHPAAALHPPVFRVRRTRRFPGLGGLAAANLARTPGRTLVAVVGLAVGVAALTLLAAILWAFDGAVVGTLLGDAVSMRAREVDVLAIVATVVLGLFAVTDVLYLNIRERGSEFAVLRATGWAERDLGRLVLSEAAGIGLLGTLLGAGTGLAGVAWLTGALSSRLLGVTGLVAVTAVALTLAAALVPVLLLRRLPTAALLAED